MHSTAISTSCENQYQIEGEYIIPPFEISRGLSPPALGGVPKFWNLANIISKNKYFDFQQTTLIIVTTKNFDKSHTNENYTHFAIGKFDK